MVIRLACMPLPLDPIRSRPTHIAGQRWACDIRQSIVKGQEIKDMCTEVIARVLELIGAWRLEKSGSNGRYLDLATPAVVARLSKCYVVSYPRTAHLREVRATLIVA